MQWKTKNQERKKRKRKGLARTLGAVTAIGSSLGLGSLINTETESTETLQTQIQELNKQITEETEKTNKAKEEAEQQKKVNIQEHTKDCHKVVSANGKN